MEINGYHQLSACQHSSKCNDVINVHNILSVKRNSCRFGTTWGWV